GAGETLQCFSPECFRPGPIVFLQPINVVAVGPWAIELQFASMAKRLVEEENFVQQQDERGGVEQQMMIRQRKGVFSLARVKQCEAHQRRRGQLESAMAFRVQEGIQPVGLILTGKTA